MAPAGPGRTPSNAVPAGRVLGQRATSRWLMATLFALGMMSVGWMVFVAALIALEKLWPWRAAASRSVAIVLAVLGLGLLVAPDLVPGLGG